jgi:Domain of unknown function (DUF4340)
MNRKQFTILIVLLIILGGAGWYVQQGRNRAADAGEQGTGQKLLGDAFPMNDVTRVNIKEGTNELNLVKRDDLWCVRERNDYPASFSTISEMLIKLKDLKVVQSEQVGFSQLPRLQLAPPGQGTNSGTIVDLLGKDDKSIKTFTLGKKHMRKAPAEQASQLGEEGFADGRYVLLAGNPQNALLIADPLQMIEAKPEAWLNKDFFKVERPKAIAVEFPAATNSWKLQRDAETGNWQLANGKADEKLDDARVSGVSSPFASPSFNDVLSTNTKPAEVGLDKPTVVTVDTFDDLTYTVKIGAKTGENYPLTVTVAANFPKERIPAKDEKPEDKVKADKAWADRQKQLDDKFKQAKQFEGWTYLVPVWNVDPILKDRKDLLAEKKEEPKTAEKSPDKADSSTNAPVLFDDKTQPAAKEQP